MSTIASCRYRHAGTGRTHQRALAGRLVRVATIPLTLVAAVVFVAAAHAATVRSVQGQVLVNSGQGYRLVDGSTQLEPGGTVVANPGAIAEVVYSGGCTVTVQPGSVYLVQAQPPCRTESVERRPPARERTEERTENTPPPNNGAGVGTGTAWAIGAVAIIGGGAAAYFLIPPMSP